MSKNALVAASVVVATIVEALGYTRPHVANILRMNAQVLKARKRRRRWWIPPESIPTLRRLVRDTSGRRYKLGEKGGH